MWTSSKSTAVYDIRKYMYTSEEIPFLLTGSHFLELSFTVSTEKRCDGSCQGLINIRSKSTTAEIPKG